jgi:hypothetical protein
MKVTLIGGPLDGQQTKAPDNYQGDTLKVLVSFSGTMGGTTLYKKTTIKNGNSSYTGWVHCREKNPVEKLQEHFERTRAKLK